jgi:hypothetical protein
LTVARGCTLLGCFAALALVIVYLRAEQTRCAARIAAMDGRWMELRSEMWGLQTRTARLRSPQRIHDRVASFQTGLVPPGFDAVERPRERLASRTVSRDPQ